MWNKQKGKIAISYFTSAKSRLVTLIESKWNLICEELLRWNELLRYKQSSLDIPAMIRT